MSWVAVALGVGGAAAGVYGASRSARAATDAANTQAAATNAASQQQQQASREALELQREQNRNAWALLAPDARSGRRAQSYVNSIIYGGRGARPPGRNGAGDTVWGEGNVKNRPTRPAGATGDSNPRAPRQDWAGYWAEWEPTTRNNPTNPWTTTVAPGVRARAAAEGWSTDRLNEELGRAYYDFSGGYGGGPETIDFEDTNDWLVDEYGDLMGDVETADLDQVMGDYRNTPFYQMTEDAIAADTAASELETSKALQEFLHRAGASGSVLSGNALRGEAELRNEFGVENARVAAGRRQQTFGDWLDQLQGQAGVGRDATTGMVSGGANFANNAGNLITSAGDSAARSTLAAADARARGRTAAAESWGGGVNTAITGLASGWDAWQRRPNRYWGTNTQAGDPRWPI